MVCWAYSFLPQGKWSSLSSLLEVALIIPKGFIEDIPLLSPYPSFSPSPYPSLFTLFLFLTFFLPPSLIPPLTLAHTTLHHPPTARSHLVLLPEGSSHSMSCPAITVTPTAWKFLSQHPLLGNIGFMAHLPQVNCSLPSYPPSLIALLTMSSPQSCLRSHFTPSLVSIHHVIPLERILLDFIVGVDEGWLQEIP